MASGARSKFVVPMFESEVFRKQMYCRPMGAIWWGTRGTCPPTFSDGGTYYATSPHFLSLGFVFREVSKMKMMFVTFCFHVRW